ncbi:MAG: fumarylacetoacetate hydrolase family protein [Caulobacteraceae bacterium]
MKSYAVPAPPVPTVPVEGGQSFPVRRIFCVGRNYAAHVREMGGEPEKTPPIFFTKPADAVVPPGGAVPYPQATSNFHHEIELVVALKGGGVDIAEADALDLVFGYAVGVDLTRRDLQAVAAQAGQPWDSAKAFDHSAPISAIKPGSAVPTGGISLTVNGQHRQKADLADMIWNISGIIAEASKLWRLEPGDLIFTGTPEGVGPLVRGDVVEGEIAGVGRVGFTVS